jgi:hypothetical protein
MDERNTHIISRREFARRAAMASAAASIAPADVLKSDVTAFPPAQQPPDLAKLSPQSQAEVEARIQAIFTQYGSRFSEAQKTDIRRLCFVAQPPLDRLRAYAVENGDGPALYLKPLLEREKKPAPAAPAVKAAEAPKKS